VSAVQVSMGQLLSSMCPDKENAHPYTEGGGKFSTRHPRLRSTELTTGISLSPSSAPALHMASGAHVPAHHECSQDDDDDLIRNNSTSSSMTEVPPSTLSIGEERQMLRLLVRGLNRCIDVSELDIIVIGKAPDANKVRNAILLLGSEARDCVVNVVQTPDRHMHNNHALVRYSAQDRAFVLQALDQRHGEANKNGIKVRSPREAGATPLSPNTGVTPWVDIGRGEYLLAPGDVFACNWKDEQNHICVLEDSQVLTRSLQPEGLSAMATLGQCVVRVALYHRPSRKLLKVGSGMVVHPAGLVLTASHLVCTAKPPHKMFFGYQAEQCSFLIGVHLAENTKWQYEAELATHPDRLVQPSGFDVKPWLDIAVLKIIATISTHPKCFVALGHGLPAEVTIEHTSEPPDTLAAARLGDSSRLAIGDRVTLLGYPAQHGATAAFAFEGIVNGLQDGHLLTTALMHSGASGGGCVNEACEIVGVQSHSFSAGDYAYVRLSSSPCRCWRRPDSATAYRSQAGRFRQGKPVLAHSNKVFALLSVA